MTITYLDGTPVPGVCGITSPAGGPGTVSATRVEGGRTITVLRPLPAAAVRARLGQRFSATATAARLTARTASRHAHGGATPGPRVLAAEQARFGQEAERARGLYVLRVAAGWSRITT